MRTRSLQRTAAVLLCAFLCLGAIFLTISAASAAGLKDAASADGLGDVTENVELEDTVGTTELDAPLANTQLPAFGVGIELTPPEGWVQTSASVALCVTDETGGGFASVEVRTGEDDIWLDITGSLEQTGNGYRATMQVTENGTFFARVTGLSGEIAEKSCIVECFDRAAPDLRASISVGTLHLEATDDLSGVAQITVGGASFEHGAAEIPLGELGTSELIPIQAVDHAGNRSQVILVVNPRAHDTDCQCGRGCKSDDVQPSPSPEPSPSQAPVQTQKPTQSTPAPSAPAQTPAATPSTTTSAATKAPSSSDSTTQPPDNEQPEQTPRPLTPEGQATVLDDATEQDGKEFFTFTTPNENTFYLVIDKQRDSENVYFLNAVTESDLQALAEKDKEPEPSVSAIPEPEPVCTCTDKCAPGAVNTDCPVCAVSMKDCTGTAPAVDPEPEPEPEKPEKGGSGGAMILLLIAALAAGGAGYYLKVWKPKHDLDDAEDFDALTGEDEETINEDDPEPKTVRGFNDEPEEPDFQSGYGPEEDE